MTTPTPTPKTRYCEPTDLIELLGQLSEDIPRYIGSEIDSYGRYIEAAAEEIDMVVGRKYALPLTLTPGTADYLLLKKLNRFIAAGRILMGASAANEKNGVHKYASYLLAEASSALNAIAGGYIELDQPENPSSKQDYDSGPAIFLSDSDSFVRDFYGFGGAEFAPGMQVDGTITIPGA